LQVCILASDVGDTRTGLVRVEVVVTYDEGLRVAAVEILEEGPEC
jgi:hypothetical protein